MQFISYVVELNEKGRFRTDIRNESAQLQANEKKPMLLAARQAGQTRTSAHLLFLIRLSVEGLVSSLTRESPLEAVENPSDGPLTARHPARPVWT